MPTHYVPTSADLARPTMLELGWGWCRGNSASRRLKRVCSGQLKKATRSRSLQMAFVAPTGVDPVTFRFSVERSTN